MKKRERLHFEDMRTHTLMRISRDGDFPTPRTQSLFRYCLSCNLLSSFSFKSLNPNRSHSAFSLISPYTKSLLCNSSFLPYSFCSSESYPLQTYSFYLSSSNHCFTLYLLQKKQSLSTSSSGPASNCFPIVKNHFSFVSSNWSSSRCKFESRSRHKMQSLYYYSSGCSSKICCLAPLFLQSSGSLKLFKHNPYYISSNCGCLQCRNIHRCFTVSSSNGTFISGPEESEVQYVANVFPDQQKLGKRNNFLRKFVLEIIKIIRNNGNDLESRLSMGASRLSVYSITEIFEILNSQRIFGLRFIEWIWSNYPQLHNNAHICSLIIDNLGRLDDYETMSTLLNKFRSKNICLTYEAFGFLPVLVSPTSTMESTKRVVDLLSKIGGSCRNSGVYALIEMFSKLDLFEMAKYVIKITERKESYYCLLIREKCERGLIEDARGIIREMRELQWAPSTTVYNYLLGSLYKNGTMDEVFAVLDEMNKIGIPPDAITFEVLILFVCRLSKMDAVHQLLDQMVCQGLEPRPATHAAIVKALFSAEKYEDAHKYVVDSSITYKTSSNMMYSLIASLYWEKGDIMSSLRVLVEMMEKRLKPNFSIYMKIVKQLKSIGRRNLARDLEGRYSKFVPESHARHL